MKKDDRGLSLIELIVTVAIMSVFLAIIGISASIISKRKVSNAADNLKSTILLAENYAKSKGNCKLSIQQSSSGENVGCKIFIYVGDSTVAGLDVLFPDSAVPSNCKLGDGPSIVHKRITTTVYYGDTPVVVGKDAQICDINFMRSTGGFTTSYYGDLNQSYSDAASGIPTKIEMTNGSSTAILDLSTYTGKITLSYEK